MYVCQLNVSKHRLQLLGSVVAFQTMHKLCYGLFIQHKLSNGDIKRELFPFTVNLVKCWATNIDQGVLKLLASIYGSFSS